jgi:hypothetical protein
MLLQPSDRLKVPDQSGRKIIANLLYDNSDLTAMALRGLNAQQGRKAGRHDQPEYPCKEFADKLDADAPLAERYFLEYPHAIVLLFRLGWVVKGDPSALLVPSAVLDGSYGCIAIHQPRSEGERVLWERFVTAVRLYMAVMILFLLGLLVLLQQGCGVERLKNSAFYLVLPGALFFTLSRFDIIPSTLVLVSFVCLNRKKVLLSALFLGLASLTKVYPLLFAPLIVRHLWPGWRLACLWCVTYGATLLLGLFPLAFGEDVRGLTAPYLFQATRPVEAFSFYGYVFPSWLAQGTTGTFFRLTCLLGALAWLTYSRIPDLETLLQRAALFVLVFISVSAFYSPQWFLWLTPLLIPLTNRRPFLGILLVALDLFTYGDHVLSLALKTKGAVLLGADQYGALHDMKYWVENYARFVLFLLIGIVVARRGAPCLEKS